MSEEREQSESVDSTGEVESINKTNKLVRKYDEMRLVVTENERIYRKNFRKSDLLSNLIDLLRCTKCLFNFKHTILKGRAIYSHPLLGVLMCESCSLFYGDGEFSLDEDGEDKYCRWCGEGGKLLLCSKCICGFCPRCIKNHFGKKEADKIKRDDGWLCYFCNPQPLWKLRSVCALTLDMVEQKNNSNQKRKSIENSEERQNKEIRGEKNIHKSDKHSTPHGSRNSKALTPRRKRTKSFQMKKVVKSNQLSSADSDSDVPPVAKKKRLFRRSIRREESIEAKSSSSNSTTSTSSESDEESDEVNQSYSDIFKAKEVNMEKVIGMLKVTGLISKLCWSMCQKKINRFEKRDFSASKKKLVNEFGKLRSMIILMSTSLSTINSLIRSFQQKFGLREDNLNDMFYDTGYRALLYSLSRILSHSNVKEEDLIDVIHEIFKTNSYLELVNKNIQNDIDTISTGVSNKSTSCSDNLNIKPSNDISISNDIQCMKLSSSNLYKFEEENNIGGGLSNKATVNNENSGEITHMPGKPLERTGDDSDAMTQIFDFENYKGVDKANDKSNSSQMESDECGGMSRKSFSDFNTDIDKVYEESLMLKKLILNSDSDDISSNESTEPLIFEGRNNSKIKGEKRKKCDKNVPKLTEEERELKRLLNITSLERKSVSKKVDKNVFKVNTEDHNIDRKETEAEPDNGYSSEYKNDDFSKRFENYVSDTDCLRTNALMLKEHLLKSTSESEDNVSEERTKREIGEEDEVEECQSIKTRPRRLHRLLRQSLTESNSSEDKTYRNEHPKKKKNSNLSLQSTDISTSSDFENFRRRKNKSCLVTSDSEDNISIEESEHKKGVKSDSPVKGRKNIKKIMMKENLKLETRQAAKEENERKKRMAEKNEEYNRLFPITSESDRLVLDFDRDTKEILLEVPQELLKFLKLHQKKGVKFMWDCCFESVKNLESHSGSGCILAHCMGLGKTLQIITLIYTLMKNNLGMNTVLILCPLNVVKNWVREFEIWLDNLDFELEVYNLNDSKTSYLRFCQLKRWYNDGGVLISSYDMMRNLVNIKTKNHKGSAMEKFRFREFLIDPGPDLVICDEGHILKNEGTALSKTMTDIKTSRRIVLTGTPLQNNLLEYHAMIQFVKPNILGTKREFMNRFVNPIMNGQFEDSNESDVRLMRARSHVLHKILDGCIQRMNYSVLMPYLPEKHEYVISVRLTETQSRLYEYYVNIFREKLQTRNLNSLFSDFNLLQKVWTHPLVLARYFQGLENDDETDSSALESGETIICLDDKKSEDSFWKKVIKPEEYGKIESSGKLLLLFDILRYCKNTKEKVLVFSQSLVNLNLIEEFLNKANDLNKGNHVPDIPDWFKDTWQPNIDYFRLDGSTHCQNRSKWCRFFNDRRNKRGRLFLISTKAGGMGINLSAANRVVLFDVSWNPSHDVQSMFRVYRFGQTRSCYIYRFVAEGTMEEKIYARQVTKLCLEKRVLDEQQIERHYKMGNLQELYNYNPLPKSKWTLPILPKDLLLAEILNLRKDVIVSYHEHDSLLENKEEEELTEEERKAAWEDFEKERLMIEGHGTNMKNKEFLKGQNISMPDMKEEVLKIISQSSLHAQSSRNAAGSSNQINKQLAYIRLPNVQNVINFKQWLGNLGQSVNRAENSPLPPFRGTSLGMGPRMAF